MIVTLNEGYIYDGATGRLFKADTNTYLAIQKSLDKIKLGQLDAAEMPHIPYIKARPENAPAPNQSTLGYPSKIVITITEQCNLRCTYCPYPLDSEREHHIQGKHFDRQSMTKVRDFLIETVGPETSLSFYGGEPLYRFKDIKYLVEELITARPDWRKLFSMTTNLSVSSKAIFDWLAQNRAVLLVSIDGPKHINDRNRPDDKKNGSYDRVIKNLNAFKEQHPHHYSNFIALNSVIAATDFDEVDRYFALNFSDVAMIRFAAASYHGKDELERMAYQKVHHELETWALQKLVSLKSIDELKQSPLALDFARKNILSVMARGSIINGRKKFTSCAPGDKMIINSDGSVGVCEKTEKISLGNISNGTEGRQDIADEFVQMLNNRCRYCFAAPCCNVCYAMMWDGEKLSRNLLDRYCETFRGRTLRMLNVYVTLREKFVNFDDRIVDICNGGSQHLFDEE